MAQNNLKREFSKSTVQRMRNIITGNASDKTKVQSGYELKNTEHKEGDIWEENGKKWTIKNGIKQSISKNINFKKLNTLPLICPECKSAMDLSDANKKMYAIHGTCLNCVTKKETEIKVKGEWQDYVSKQLNSNKNAMLEDAKNELESWLNETSTFVSENGDIENWLSLIHI